MINITFKRGQKKAKLAKKVLKLSFAMNRLFRFGLTVTDGKTSYRFLPTNLTEYYRAITFFTKEEGTIAWLDNFLKEGDVLYDIGANIGLYSLYAGKLGRNVKTYAFEPHKFTFVNLMNNISINGLLGSIFPISIPLNDTSDVSTMNYAQLDSGTSMSQLGHAIHPEDGAFKPKLEEVVYSATLDELIWKRAIPTPNHIKIDVDGNEVKILKGMTKLLGSIGKPHSIQVEINPGQNAEVTAFLTSFGYKLDHVHYTADGNIKMQKGVNPDEMGYNAVFVSA